MTARNQPHKYRCGTCKNTDCDRYNERNRSRSCSDRDGRMDSAASFTFYHGCGIHSDATKAEQRIVDVIAELKRLRDVPLKSHWKEQSISINISHVIKLLTSGVK